MLLPEHEKLEKVHTQSQACGEFIDWLREEKGYVLAEWGKGEFGEEVLMPVREGIMSLLSAFFDIDQNKLEAEKRQILEEMQRLGDATDPSVVIATMSQK